MREEIESVNNADPDRTAGRYDLEKAAELSLWQTAESEEAA